MLPRVFAPALVVAALLLAAGCNVEVVVDVQVDAGGSGRVEVTVGLDQDAAERAGDLSRDLRLDDLVDAGWATSHTVELDGSAWIRASKAFSSTEELRGVLEEVAGIEGPFSALSLQHSSSWLGDTYSVSGEVRASELDVLIGDPDLAAHPGDPLGSVIEAVEAEEGVPATEMIDVELRVQLPGEAPVAIEVDLTSSAPTVVDVSSDDPNLVGRSLPWLILLGVLAVVATAAAAVFGRSRRRRGSHFA